MLRKIITPTRAAQRREAARPLCIGCHLPMIGGGTLWQCREGCKVSIYTHTLGELYGATEHHPACLKCRKRMARFPETRNGVCVFLLKVGTAARVLKPLIDVDEMLRVIDSKLSGYSVEMREELRQEIALAIVGGSRIKGELVAIETLTPAMVKEIARPIFKLQPNRFRDVSLDHQYGDDGQRLEERLVG